jgi:hypothetical protein
MSEQHHSETATAGGQLLTFYKHLFWTRVTENSPRREPWGLGIIPRFPSPGGATEAPHGWGPSSVAPPGLRKLSFNADPRLTPWAIVCRRSAAVLGSLKARHGGHVLQSREWKNAETPGKGGAFPHSERRSRSWGGDELSVIWTSPVINRRYKRPNCTPSRQRICSNSIN